MQAISFLLARRSQLLKAIEAIRGSRIATGMCLVVTIQRMGEGEYSVAPLPSRMVMRRGSADRASNRGTATAAEARSQPL